MRAVPIEHGRRRCPARCAVGVVLAAFAMLGAACSDEAGAAVRLNVIFPSTAMAIASDNVKFVVYDDPTPGACQSIYLKHVTNQSDVPPVVLEAPAVPVCALAFQRLEPIVLPLGRHSILAIATRDGADLLVGCSDVALSSEGGEVTVTLALPGETQIPEFSACTSLRDWCEERCD